MRVKLASPVLNLNNLLNAMNIEICQIVMQSRIDYEVRRLHSLPRSNAESGLKQGIISLSSWLAVPAGDFAFIKLFGLALNRRSDPRLVYNSGLLFEPVVELFIEPVLLYCGSI